MKSLTRDLRENRIPVTVKERKKGNAPTLIKLDLKQDDTNRNCTTPGTLHFLIYDICDNDVFAPRTWSLPTAVSAFFRIKSVKLQRVYQVKS